jgi:hypothetical protein
MMHQDALVIMAAVVVAKLYGNTCPIVLIASAEN